MRFIFDLNDKLELYFNERNLNLQMAVKSLDNWSGSQADSSNTINDPLVEQINIIKGYLKQARDALRFEEVISHMRIYHKNGKIQIFSFCLFQVETLQLNLQELQEEFYNRQKAKEQANQQNTDGIS